MGGTTALAAQGGAAKDPLRVLAANPRYFTDGSGRAIYLTGFHTRCSLQDMGDTDPPPAFDYPALLDDVTKHGHNFMRLWMFEQARWASWTTGDHFTTPLPLKVIQQNVEFVAAAMGRQRRTS
jgi:hypothetical protein